MQNRLFKSAITGLASLLLVHSTHALNYFWNGAGDGTSWSDGANWDVGVEPTNNTAALIFLGSGYPTTTPNPINIGVSDSIQVDTIFGPEWGETLNIQGTVDLDFNFFPVGDSAHPVVVNISGNASFTAHDTFSTGAFWWWPGGPYVTVNVTDNAQVICRYLAMGGHVNIADNATVTVSNAVLSGTIEGPVWSGGLDNDTTRYINMLGGTLVLPPTSSGVANDLITRGILLNKGVQLPANPEFFHIDETNDVSKTVVTPVDLGSATGISLQLTKTNFIPGGLAKSQTSVSFAGVTNVTVATADSITYESSNTNVVTISSEGLVRAVSPGTATVTAYFDSVSTPVQVTVSPDPYTPNLIHRYSFNESSGFTVSDSVGGASWDGFLAGDATFNGSQVTLGGFGWVELPGGVVSNLDTLTIEAWATFDTVISNWAGLYAFGDYSQIDPNQGRNYIAFQPHTGFGIPTTDMNLTSSDPGNLNEERTQMIGVTLDGYTNVHIACVYHPYAGYNAMYTNGILAAINTSIMTPLAAALGTDPFNYLGRTLYAADPYLIGSINEFRIHNGPLSAGQIQASSLLGPNQLIGSNTNVTLTATLSGANLVVTWSTNSALVDLISSPALGSGATWTSVNASMNVVGGNYQVTLPATASAQFLRLKK